MTSASAPRETIGPRGTTTAQDWWLREPPQHLAAVLTGRAAATPDKVIASRRTAGQWVDLTARELAEEVQQVARGLVAAGIEQGDRVALMSRTRYEWALVDLAILAAGAVTVPVYETSSRSQLAWVLRDSGARAIVAEGGSASRLLTELGEEGADEPEHVWTIEAVSGRSALAELIALGESEASGHDAEIARRQAALTPEDTATIIYTSGTLGRPKGAVLTHRAFLTEITGAIEALPELFQGEESSTLLFLPLAHVFGRMVHFAVILAGSRTGYTDIARVAKDLPEFAPTFVLAVPRVFEKILDTAQRKAHAGGKGRIFDRAVDVAARYSRSMDAGRPGLVVTAQRALYDRLVYSKVKAAFGGRLRYAIVGGAAMGERLNHCFRGMGITLLEGYGLTETSAATAVNRVGRQRIGTVGVPLPGVQVRLDDDGVLEVKGGPVFSGYWRNEEATAAALRDGWLSTGDLATIDPDGFVSIVGRQKEILVTSGGKNVAPVPMEDLIRSVPIVSQAMVIGDGRPTVMALVTLDEEYLPTWFAAQGREPVPVEQLVDDPAVLEEVAVGVERANASVSQAEAIKKVRVLPHDFTVEREELTPSMKIRRHVIAGRYADLIEEMYARRSV